MSNQSVGNQVQADLTQAVDSGLLTEAVQQKAAQLLARLQKPVRLAIMGMPGSGKSTLLNLLVGHDVLPEGLRLPTLQLSYGSSEKAICTLPDGTKMTFDTLDSHAIAALSPLFVELQMPLPALAKISVLEVVAPNDPDAIHRASQWAAKRCDIALWCTRAFNDDEQRIWFQMPDLIKDHAFLMVTKADKSAASGSLDAALAAVRAVARDEFNEIIPIATPDAIAARQPDGSIDKEKLRSSGGLALISAVLKQVELGRQSTIDMADVLLRQNENILAQLKPVVVPETPQAQPEPAPSEPKPESPDATVTDDVDESKVIETVVSRLRGVTEPPPMLRDIEGDDDNDAKPDAEPVATTVANLQPATRDAYQHVLDHIAEQGRNLADTLEDMGEGAPTEVMAQAVEHIQWLSDYLNDHGDDSDAALQRARDTAFDAADLVQLMQMERRDSAALEAVSLLIQIKRELQADLAA